MSAEEIAIEMEEVLPFPLPEDIDETLTKNMIPRRLVIQNVALQSWIPTILAGFFLILLGMYFLFVQFESWTVDSIISVSLIGNGLVFFLISRKEAFIFEEIEGKLKVQRTTWKGVGVTEYWLLHIKDVSIEEYKDPQGGTDYELYLYLKSGQRVKLFSGQIIGVGRKRKEKARAKIHEFLENFNKKYTTKSVASHSGYRKIMKRHLAGT